MKMPEKESPQIARLLSGNPATKKRRLLQMQFADSLQSRWPLHLREDTILLKEEQVTYIIQKKKERGIMNISALHRFLVQ